MQFIGATDCTADRFIGKSNELGIPINENSRLLREKGGPGQGRGQRHHPMRWMDGWEMGRFGEKDGRKEGRKE